MKAIITVFISIVFFVQCQTSSSPSQKKTLISNNGEMPVALGVIKGYYAPDSSAPKVKKEMFYLAMCANLELLNYLKAIALTSADSEFAKLKDKCNIITNTAIDQDHFGYVYEIIRKDLEFLRDKKDKSSLLQKLFAIFFKPRTIAINQSEEVENTFSRAFEEVNNPALDYQVSEDEMLRLLDYLSRVFQYARQYNVKNYSISDRYLLFLDRGMSPVMKTRCFYYLNFTAKDKLASVLGMPHHLGSCLAAFDKMFSVLDFTYFMPSNIVQGYSAYISDFIDLLSEESTGRYLLSLHKTWTENPASFNVWESTQQYYKEDPDLGLKMMTLLFQNMIFDSNETFLSYYPKTQEKFEIFKENRTILINFLKNVRNIKQVMRIKDVEDLEPSVDRVYHYFTPYYLAKKLKEAGVDDLWAASVPLFFNTSYEYYKEINSKDSIDLANTLAYFLSDSVDDFSTKYRQIPQMISNSLSVFDDPKTLVGFEDMATLEDIYFGYAGVLRGIGRSNLIMNVEEFKKQFLPNPKQFIIDLMATISEKKGG